MHDWKPITPGFSEYGSFIIYDPRWGVSEGCRFDSGKWGLATFNGQVTEAHPTHYRPMPASPDTPEGET